MTNWTPELILAELRNQQLKGEIPYFMTPEKELLEMMANMSELRQATEADGIGGNEDYTYVLNEYYR